ncbi:unnamed protein product [Moneuplotes crassus]|uniref:Uncharacterized protein n=1 Tax=Euplotes crassus TaxID=5936 RepID=A0AAD1UJB6_EUPCR|nr:unnamed protein product [Moneuplotes crassus]
MQRCQKCKRNLIKVHNNPYNLSEIHRFIFFNAKGVKYSMPIPLHKGRLLWRPIN